MIAMEMWTDVVNAIARLPISTRMRDVGSAPHAEKERERE